MSLSGPAAWSLRAGVVAFLAYALFAPAVAGPGDAAELTLALATAGVPHPTGYPLYVLGGHLFGRVLVALGASWPHAANLWSAAGAGVALGFYTRLALDLAGAGSAAGATGPGAPPHGSAALRAVAALGAVLLLALHPVWLGAATLAEVYSWAAAWVAAAAWLALRLASGLAARGAAAGGHREAALWGLACGAGLAHHTTAALFALPLTAALALAARRAGAPLAPRALAAAGGVAVSLSAYGFVAARAFRPAAWQWPLLEPSWSSVWAHVGGGPFAARYFGRFDPNPMHGALLDTTVWPLLVPGLLLGSALAARGAGGAARPVWVALLAGAVLRALFVTAYGVPDPAAYLIAPLAVAFLVLPLAAARAPGRWLAPLAAAAILLPALLAPGWLGIQRLRLERVVAVEARIRALWRSVPIARGIVFWHDDRFAMLELFRRLDGERPGLIVENPAMLTWPAPRAAFARRVGGDPLAGLELRDERDLARIPAHVARVTGLPVVDFGALSRGEDPLAR